MSGDERGTSRPVLVVVRVDCASGRAGENLASASRIAATLLDAGMTESGVTASIQIPGVFSIEIKEPDAPVMEAASTRCGTWGIVNGGHWRCMLEKDHRGYCKAVPPAR